MYSVSDEVKALALAPSRHICPYVTVASKSGGTWVYDRVYRDTDNLVSVSVDIGSNSGGLVIGTAYSAKLTLRLMGNVSVSQKDHIIVRVRFYKEGVEQPYDISLGGYFVDTITKKDQLTTIVAYDKMLRGAKIYKPTALTFPCRLSAILDDICDKMEISLRSGVTMPYDPVINSAPVRGTDSDGNTLYFTRREMLGYIASLMGGNWFFDPGGKLAFTQFAEVEDDFAAENSTAADISTDAYTVAGISWNVNGVSCSRFDDLDATGVLEFTTPLDVDAKEPIIGALEQKLVGLTYHGGTIQRQGCGWFELGDIVTAARKDGSTAPVLITGINYCITGGAFTEKIYSSALTDSQSNYTSGDVTGQSVPQSVAQEESTRESAAGIYSYEYLSDLSVKFNDITYTVEKDSETGLISKISDDAGNSFEPTINSGIADVALHNAVFWAVAMHSGLGESPRTIMLYNSGDEAVSKTGGWYTAAENYVSSGDTASMAKNPDNITLETKVFKANNTHNTYIAAGTQNAINLSEYSKLVAVFDGSGSAETPTSGSGKNSCQIYALNSYATNVWGFTDHAAYDTFEPTGDFSVTKETLTADISDLSGSYYIAFRAGGTSTIRNSTWKLKQVYLQK